MLKYKGIELREEDINENGVELLICIENKSNLSDEKFIETIWRVVPSCRHFYTYVGSYDNTVFEVRSNRFTLNKVGVDELRENYYALKEDLKDAKINIGVCTEDFLFGGGDYKQYKVSFEEFEKNIEFVD